MIPEATLEAFKDLWKKHYHEDISDTQATEEALNLLNIFNTIYRPLRKSWMNENDYEIINRANFK